MSGSTSDLSEFQEALDCLKTAVRDVCAEIPDKDREQVIVAVDEYLVYLAQLPPPWPLLVGPEDLLMHVFSPPQA